MSSSGYQDRFDVTLRLNTPSGGSLPQRRPASGPSQTRQQSIEEASEPSKRQHGRLIASVSGFHTTPMIDRLIGLSSDDVALGIYYSSLCVNGSAVWSQERIQAQGNGCLYAAIRLMGITTSFQKCTFPNSPATLWRGCMDAIQFLNLALASPSESQADSMLLVTRIKTAFETKDAPSQSLGHWEVHTKGAAALLLFRGAHQVTSRLGSALFVQASSHMATSYILAERQIPEELHLLREATRVHLIDPNNPAWRYQGALFRLTDFLAMARIDISALTDQGFQKIIAEAISIYTGLLEIF